MDDLALAVALTAGDEDAFRTLVELETPSVFRTCYRILGRIEDAEDATQETFVLAHRSLASYRGDGRPMGTVKAQVHRGLERLRRTLERGVS